MFPCLCHEGLICDNRFGLQVVLVKIVPEDSDALDFLRSCHCLCSEQWCCSIQDDKNNDVFSCSKRNLTVINECHVTKGVRPKSTRLAS